MNKVLEYFMSNTTLENDFAPTDEATFIEGFKAFEENDIVEFMNILIMAEHVTENVTEALWNTLDNKFGEGWLK